MKLTELLTLCAAVLPEDWSQQGIADAMEPTSHQPAVSLFIGGGVKKPTDEWITRFTAALNKLRRRGVKRVTEDDVRRAHARTVGITYRRPSSNPSRIVHAA